MIPLMTGEKALRRLFGALTEHTFQTELGVADPRLTDYLTDLLCRFIRQEEIYRFRDADGRRLTEVAAMLEEAGQRQAGPQRELHRHIGDYTLFWSGVFPEALPRLRAPDRRDHLIDFERQGRESYHIASTIVDEAFHEDEPILRQLSADFELCRRGLRMVREEWDRLPQDSAISHAQASSGN